MLKAKTLVQRFHRTEKNIEKTKLKVPSNIDMLCMHLSHSHDKESLKSFLLSPQSKIASNHTLHLRPRRGKVIDLQTEDTTCALLEISVNTPGACEHSS